MDSSGGGGFKVRSLQYGSFMTVTTLASSTMLLYDKVLNEILKHFFPEELTGKKSSCKLKKLLPMFDCVFK